MVAQSLQQSDVEALALQAPSLALADPQVYWRWQQTLLGLHECDVCGEYAAGQVGGWLCGACLHPYRQVHRLFLSCITSVQLIFESTGSCRICHAWQQGNEARWEEPHHKLEPCAVQLRGSLTAHDLAWLWNVQVKPSHDTVHACLLRLCRRCSHARHAAVQCSAAGNARRRAPSSTAAYVTSFGGPTRCAAPGQPDS